jgi:hypothetical protein
MSALLACQGCGRLVTADFVNMADFCPACKASPFPEAGPARPADDPCCCEHIDHDLDPDQHAMFAVPAGTATAGYVGRICDSCAQGHYAQFVRPA